MMSSASRAPSDTSRPWWSGAGRGCRPSRWGAGLGLVLAAGAVGLVAAMLPGAVAAQGASGAAPTLMPHEAVYELRLISRAPGTPVVSANGSMRYRIADTCDGWAMESRTKLDLFYNRGDPIETDWSFISWESKDGTKYRFRIRSERNGSVDEIIDGRAAREPDGGGVATFTQPEEKRMTLDPAVMLPAEHTFAVLKAARAGDRLFTAQMFDGSEPAGPMQATAVVTEEVPAGEATELPDHPLLAGPSWRMVISFFAPEGDTSLPEYEVRLRYHENGVAEEVIQDFGTMALRASLRSLTKLDDDGC
ncbi:EipB family protein [Roseospira goensis]|uniref:DUF1849 family protein n=1 Tax=Roseospira goensis TaxID=391922 RepID=A0A7W6WKR6_9PROT|nr:DUF1849 family protein [Roseospira goensis]MBB4286621.1 hypothetical protein [Roseospira goensis]